MVGSVNHGTRALYFSKVARQSSCFEKNSVEVEWVRERRGRTSVPEVASLDAIGWRDFCQDSSISLALESRCPIPELCERTSCTLDELSRPRQAEKASTLGLRIATLALTAFRALPSKCKPRILADGRREWTTLSAVILARHADTKDEILTCTSLATGTKCLPATTLPWARGRVLHDCHAEILTIRGFSRFLLSEIQSMLAVSADSTASSSPFIEPVPASGYGPEAYTPPFRLRRNVTVHLFTTSAPCGSASLDLLIDSRPEDNEPWNVPALVDKCNDDQKRVTLESPNGLTEVQHGHANFHPSLLSAVRTKPSRPDAPATLSKSCSDKLALSQFTGVLKFPVGLLLQPIFFRSIVVPRSEFHAQGWKRAFGQEGRLKAWTISAGDWSVDNCSHAHGSLPPRFFGFEVVDDADVGFEYSRTPNQQQKVSNASALFVQRATKSSRGEKDAAKQGSSIELLINGVKQGFRQDSSHEAKDSVVSRRNMWALGRCVAVQVGKQIQDVATNCVSEQVSQACQHNAETTRMVLNQTSYAEAKRALSRSARDTMKTEGRRRLGGWVVNTGDEDWGPA